MKTLMFAVFVLLMPVTVFSAEKFSVTQDEAGVEESGKVTLIYTVANEYAFAVSSLDIVVHQGLELDKLEAGAGWVVPSKTASTAHILPGGALRPGGSGRIKLVVSLHGEGPSPFQVRKPAPVMTITTMFTNGEKATRTIYPPFIQKMKRL